MPKYGWWFRKKSPGETENERDDDRTFSDSPDAESIINEFGQNLNDEIDPTTGANSPRMVVTIGKVADNHKPFVKSLFNGFKSHLKESGSKDSDMVNCNGEIPFVVLEDFGTRGLVGDITQAKADQPRTPRSARNNFYDFHRRIGKSSKSSTEYGSKGVGNDSLTGLQVVSPQLAHNPLITGNEAVLPTSAGTA